MRETGARVKGIQYSSSKGNSRIELMAHAPSAHQKMFWDRIVQNRQQLPLILFRKSEIRDQMGWRGDAGRGAEGWRGDACDRTEEAMPNREPKRRHLGRRRLPTTKYFFYLPADCGWLLETIVAHVFRIRAESSGLLATLGWSSATLRA